MDFIEEMAPSTLFKFWKEKAFADEFLQGKIIIRPLAFYRDIEDSKRIDKEEGEGKIQIPGNVPSVKFDIKTRETRSITYEPGVFSVSITTLNPTYIFCMGGPNINLGYGVSRFGKWAVKIKEPTFFIKDVEDALKKDYGKFNPWIDTGYVRYDKQSILEEPNPLDSYRMAYLQKNVLYKDECEFRLAVKFGCDFKDPIPDRLELQLTDVKKYADLLS